MKTGTIEEFLSWAFVEELAKGGGVEGVAGGGSAWSLMSNPMNALHELGTKVDESWRNAEPAAFILAQGDPHPDAMAAGAAVRALGDLCYRDDLADVAEWLVADWLEQNSVEHHHMIRAAAAEAVAGMKTRGAKAQGRGLVALVIRCAVLGREPHYPDWCPPIRYRRRGSAHLWYVSEEVTDSLGKSHRVEHEAVRDPKTRRMPASAYRKMEFEYSPVGDLMLRFDYLAWRAALRQVEASLAREKLEKWRISPLRMPFWPSDLGLSRDLLQKSSCFVRTG